jgi:hypothetical protein
VSDLIRVRDDHEYRVRKALAEIAWATVTVQIFALVGYHTATVLVDGFVLMLSTLRPSVKKL